ncbi:MAG: thioredoxin domain-containing protein [Nocardioidaceae bacterium]
MCRAFEQALGPTITDDVDSGTIKVEYRPMAFLDDKSTTKYSSRALETAACALDRDGRHAFFALHDLLYDHQPAEGSAGLADSELADLAVQAGADKSAVESCQSDGTFAGWVADVTDQASQDGVTGTPTILVDGKKVTFTDGVDPKQNAQGRDRRCHALTTRRGRSVRVALCHNGADPVDVEWFT